MTAARPHEPVPVTADQQALTDRHLVPRQAAIESMLVAHRAAVDAALAPKLPRFGDKPYPLGRCREIRDAVVARLQAALKAPADPAAAALRAFIAAGGVGRKVWGDLRGDYFQNALQFGAWYVDVANDTVTVSKPQVEILPLAEADLRPIRDFAHFVRIAERYWQVTVTANTVFPRLAPLLPLVCTEAGGRSWLAAACDPMIDLSRLDGFRPAEAALRALPVTPGPVAAALRAQAARADDPLLRPDGDPVEWCLAYRARGLGPDDPFRDACVAAFLSLHGRAAGPL